MTTNVLNGRRSAAASMATAYDVIAGVGPDDDVRLVVATGYAAKVLPGVTPDGLADAAADFVAKTGVPLATFVRFVCSLIDEADKGDMTAFAAYVGDVAVALRRPTQSARQPQPAAPAAQADTPPARREADFTLRLKAEEANAIGGYLSGDLVAGAAVGEVLHRVQARHATDGTATCFMDVLQTDHGVVLDVYVMSGRRHVASAKPQTVLASPIKLPHSEGVIEVAVVVEG